MRHWNRFSPGGVEAGGNGEMELVAGDQHGARAQRLQVLQDVQIVVRLHSVAQHALQPLERLCNCTNNSGTSAAVALPK